MIETIDIESIVKAKTGRQLPKWICRIAKKIICLDRINYIITKYGEDNTGIAFAEKVLEELDIETSIKGEDNIPTDRPLVFAWSSGGVGYRQAPEPTFRRTYIFYYQRDIDLYRSSTRYFYPCRRGGTDTRA